MANDTVKFCPQCGSASVDYSELAGGSADCRGCLWKGNADELLVVPIQHDFAMGKESIIAEMMQNVRGMLSGELGLPWLRFLLKWGFVAGDINDPANTVDRKQFSRYLAAIGRGCVAAVLEERERQECAQRKSNAPS